MPTTVHCDHLIQAKAGADIDLEVRARRSTARCTTSSAPCRPSTASGSGSRASGIIHQVVLENYAFPGGMMIGTDSHTPNAGGLGMVAIGVGGADAVDVMTGFPFNVRWPKLIGVHLTGDAVAAGRRPKDVILKVAEVLTVEGGTGAIVEYFGPGADTITRHRQGARSATWVPRSAPPRRCSPTTPNMAAYLKATGREAIADAAERGRRTTCGPTPRSRPTRVASSTESIEIDLDTLEPLINGPHTPDLAHKVGEIGADARRRTAGRCEISSALIGSCTNSSYEDITRAASIARQASAKGLQREDAAAHHARLRAGAGDHRARRPARRPRGHRRHGARQRVRPVHRPVGPHRPGPRTRSTRSSTATTATSPSATTATPTRWRSSPRPTPSSRYALAGTLDFNPLTDTLTTTTASRCSSIRPSARCCRQGLRPRRERLPRAARRRLRRPGRREARRATACSCSSPSPPWDGKDYIDLPVLMKAKGKCTTDHISAAGKWLDVPRPPREHPRQPLPRRRQRLHRRGGRGQGLRSTARPAPFPDIAKHYAEAGRRRGARSATRTTARARHASTRRWSRGSATAR